VDRPGVDGVFGELDWTLYGIEWAVYGGKGGILGTKSVLSKIFGSKTSCISELVDFYRSILLV
jgi:hypothetical protein